MISFKYSFETYEIHKVFSSEIETFIGHYKKGSFVTSKGIFWKAKDLHLTLLLKIMIPYLL